MGPERGERLGDLFELLDNIEIAAHETIFGPDMALKNAAAILGYVKAVRAIIRKGAVV